jgi:signal transduction histidine kinase/glutaredoxin
LNIYSRKKRWKWGLFSLAVLIVAASLWYTNILVKHIAKDQRRNLTIWADAIQRKADLVNYTEKFFRQLATEERKKAEILAEAYKYINIDTTSQSLTFYMKLITGNTTVPVILTDDHNRIEFLRNVDFDADTVKTLTGKLREEFTKYSPVEISYLPGKKIYLYYKDSKLFEELKVVLNDLIESFFSEIVLNSASVPVIITDSTQTKVIGYGQLDPKKVTDSVFLQKTLRNMADDNEPIEIELADQGKRYIFYQNSELLTRLMYFPYFQLGIIGLFLFIAYVLFSSARRSEQNQVWVGLAKETAHQLGTPISSMIAWIELLKLEGHESETIDELKKDIDRLHKITDRFSKIGSTPVLKKENIVKVIYNDVSYLRTRSSKKVGFSINRSEDEKVYAPINLHLFDWVIENLCKNAIDAVAGEGNIDIDISEDERYVIIDISDNGKGIPKSEFKTIFNPGYTSKKRGWGLGLSLAKRIIKEYHKGKIFVKSSVVGKGTTFRIMLKK